MSRTVRKRWTNDPEPPEAPGAEWESYIAPEQRDFGCSANCLACGKPQAKADRRRERRGKRDAIREQLS